MSLRPLQSGEVTPHQADHIAWTVAHLLPADSKDRPPERDQLVLSPPVAFPISPARVVRVAVDLDREAKIRIGEIHARYEGTVVVANLVLGDRWRQRRIS